MTATLSRGTVKALRDQLAKRLADDPDDAEVIASEASEVIRKLHLALEHQLGTCELEGRDLLASEARNFSELRDSITALEAVEKRAQLQANRNRGLPDDFLEIVARNHEQTTRQLRSIAEDSASTYPEGFPVTSSTIEVRSEPTTYGRPDRRHSYFADLARRQMFGDSEAAARLQRHALEVAATATPEQRAASRLDGSAGEFTPPMWMVDAFIPLAREGRVSADRFAKFALPPSTDSLAIPKIQQGTLVASQSADNATIASQDITSSTVTAPIITLAGSSDFALQLVEQSPIQFDNMILQDLVAAHARALGSAVLTGTGTNGQLEGILTNTDTTQVTYTAASPTAAGIYNALASAVNSVAANLFSMPDAVVMHPRRWTWLLTQVDSTGRPLVVPTANGGQSVNALAPANALSLGDVVGTVHGLPVYLDPLIPTNLGAGTNEDRIIVAKWSTAHLYESDLRTAIFFDGANAKTLSVTARLHSYVASTGVRRYAKAFSIIKGTGLAATL